MNERKWELDVIRGIVCFFVVVIHVAGHGMSAMEPLGLEWSVRNLVICLVRCAVPIFFMMSGILFMEKELTIKILYKKYIFRLIVVWGVWSAFYALIDFAAYWRAGGISFKYFIVCFLTGHYHLWFLPSLLVAYVFLPILQGLVKGCSKIHMFYLGIVILITVIGKETLDPFIHSPGWDGIWNNVVIPGASAGIIYFVWGYFLYKHAGKFRSQWSLLLYLSSVILMAGINYVYVWFIEENAAATYSYLGIWTAVSASSLFVFLVRVLRKYQPKAWMRKIAKSISDYTLGIYLIHAFFIEQVYSRVGLNQNMFPAGLSILLFSVMTFGISLCTVCVIRKIPYVGKWIL